MDVNKENLDSWFQSLADEALDRNSKSVYTWTKYKNDLEQTKDILSWLPKKVKHSVMVPIGPKALMRGKIIHTNELLVNIGETWFVKKSSSEATELCNRRVDACNEMLDKLNKEKELLESKKSLPKEKEAFGTEDRPEIVEFISEEEHEEWKKKHRQKEKEYREQLANMRNKEKKPIETEEDLWNRLDELELREELEDELNRLNAEEDDSDYSEPEVDESEENKESDCHSNETQMETGNNHPKQDCQSIVPDEGGIKSETEVKKKKVVFKIEDDVCDDADEPLRLEIRHSSHEPNIIPFNGVINSPADIYQAYLNSIVPQSIVKKRSDSNPKSEADVVKDEPLNEPELHIKSGIILPDIFDKNMTESGRESENERVVHRYTEPPRRISKFKASRMKKS